MRKTLFNLFLAAAALFLSWPGFAQSRLNVSGTVTDQGGYPVAGAAVLVDGTGKYAVSADNGTWSIDGVASNATLTVSCLGYEDASVQVGGRAIVNIVLSESSIMLEETVAIGYGRMKKSDLTGSVASVNPENLVSKPANSIENLMQGRKMSLLVTWRNKYVGMNEQDTHFFSVFPGHVSVNSFLEMYGRSDTFFCGDLPNMYKMAENITVQ